MELSLDKGSGLHIRSYHHGMIETDVQIYSTSIVITPQNAEIWRPKSLNDIREEDLIYLTTFNPQIVLLGTGTELKFPPVVLFRCLIEKKIGYEIMNTAAACRTYNVLMSENRAVVAGLLIE